MFPSYRNQSVNLQDRKLKECEKLSLMILTGKKYPQIKTPALTKSMNMNIWVVGTPDQLL